MSNPTARPARLRLILEGADRLPPITSHLAALAKATGAAGLTPADLHPVVHLLLR